MYHILRLRSKKAVEEVIALLENMALVDQRVHRALTAPDLPTYASTASSPSLRAREAMAAPMEPILADPDGGNVKVVVRVRKFIKRDYTDRNSRKTHEEKSFTFDKSFWSHSEEDPHYSPQSSIYASFGEEFLDHNFDGYHTCIFAYGQTGSGKSYTMMGTPSEPGLIPRTCEGLFQRIEAEEHTNITYNVHVSYFEVYNEHVRDLLTPRTTPPTYLKIRESKQDGIYIQNLTDSPVKSFAEIEKIMKTGDAN
ncbi:hypothetical protein LTR28_009631, partial [Elasticomyces elasticus]